MNDETDPPPTQLGYAGPSIGGRPTLLAAVGVMSIVVACAGLLFGGLVCWEVGSASLERVDEWKPAETWSPPAGTLSPEQQAAAYVAIGQGCNPTPAESAALRKFLASTTQPLFFPARPSRMERQLHSISSQARGPIGFSTMRGKVIFDTDGSYQLTLGKQAFRLEGTRMSIEPGWFGATACAVLAIVLAVVLLVAGLRMLRGDPRSRSLVKWYVRLKIPLAIATAVVWTLFVGEIQFWYGPTIGTLIGLGVGAAGLAFPIALLVVMRRRTIRAYYERLSTEHHTS